MKKVLSTIFALAICTLSFSQSSPNLKFHLEKGKVYKMKSVNNQNIVSSYNGNSFTTTVNSQSSVSYKLLSQNNDVMSIEFRFDTIQTKSTSPMGNKETNSTTVAKKGEYIDQLMNRFSSKSIIAKITTAGKFTGFENYKAFRDNILLGLDSVPDNRKNQIQTQIDMVVKESAMQSMIEPFFAYMPEKAVNTGDKWETSYTVAGGGMSGMVFNTITLTNLDSKTATLAISSELESMPNTDETAFMSFDIKGTSSGTMNIDANSGLIIKGTDTKKYSGSMTIKNQGKSMNMPLVVEAETVITKQ